MPNENILLGKLFKNSNCETTKLSNNEYKETNTNNAKRFDIEEEKLKE